MKNVLKGLVKTQVKEQVSRILPKVEEQREGGEQTSASTPSEKATKGAGGSKQGTPSRQQSANDNTPRTQYSAATHFGGVTEGNKSIQQSDEQRNLYEALVKAYDVDKTILDTYGESTILKRRREDDDQEGPFAGSDRGSTTGSQSRQMSASKSAFAEEPVQTTCQMEEPSHPVFEIGAEDQPIIQTTQHPKWFSQPRIPPTPDRDWNKSVPAAQGNAQSWISALAKQTDARYSFNELLDTPIDFSNFIMNRLGFDTLTPELLAGPTYELMRGSCNSLTELEPHFRCMRQVQMSNQLFQHLSILNGSPCQGNPH
nr:hypothetical protein [Tanacetum cinerariifolium]